MAASVLSTPRAVEVSVYGVRVFVRLREMLAGHKALERKMAELEGRVAGHDDALRSLVSAIRQLMDSSPPEPKRIGFRQP